MIRFGRGGSSPGSGGSDVGPFAVGFGAPDQVILAGSTPGFDFPGAGWSTSQQPFFYFHRWGRLLVPRLIPHWTNPSGDLNDYEFYNHPICLCPESWLGASYTDNVQHPWSSLRLPCDHKSPGGELVQRVGVELRFVDNGVPGLWLNNEGFDPSLFAGGNEAGGLYFNTDWSQLLMVLPPTATF